ncbi:hypothetical protein SDJN02_01844, partial [Cucurbita argyrosperma subsp. argyrosperma]
SLTFNFFRHGSADFSFKWSSIHTYVRCSTLSAFSLVHNAEYCVCANALLTRYGKARMWVHGLELNSGIVEIAWHVFNFAGLGQKEKGYSSMDFYYELPSFSNAGYIFSMPIKPVISTTTSHMRLTSASQTARIEMLVSRFVQQLAIE